MATSAIAEQAIADVKPNVVPAKPVEVVLNVNGKEHRVTIEPRTSLLHCLRDDLNLTGAKDVEDGSAIGADTVLVDGKAVHSGSVLAISCVGQKIETIDDVITGFVKHDGLQCGYCTPGFVMATRAALNKKPNASVDELKHLLGGNICRCGTYQGILHCAIEIAKTGDVATKGTN
jgi:aerobic-type carbon monoxide dehydrogenase small subunit (CoxS/CutS family)